MRERQIGDLIRQLDTSGQTHPAGLLREIYLTDNYRGAFLFGEKDVPRYPQGMRLAYAESDEGFSVVTLSLKGPEENERLRSALRETLAVLPGDPSLVAPLSDQLIGPLRSSGLRVIGGLDISEAADDSRRIASVIYPKPLSRIVGDEVAMVFALSVLKSKPIPEGGVSDPTLPIS
jgi:hypothetical protein